jgi:hypothetical protein
MEQEKEKKKKEKKWEGKQGTARNKIIITDQQTTYTNNDVDVDHELVEGDDDDDDDDETAPVVSNNKKMLLLKCQWRMEQHRPVMVAVAVMVVAVVVVAVAVVERRRRRRRRDWLLWEGSVDESIVVVAAVAAVVTDAAGLDALLPPKIPLSKPALPSNWLNKSLRLGKSEVIKGGNEDWTRRKFGDDGLPMIAVADNIATMAVTQIAICLVPQY